MSPRNLTRLHAALLRVTLGLSCWVRLSHHAVAAMDFTVQDTDPSILYQPATSWFSSSQLCSSCLDPNVSTSYHEAVNAADQDDLPNAIDSDANTSTTPSSSSPSSIHLPATLSPAPSQNLQVSTGTKPLTTSPPSKPTTASPSPTSSKSTEDSGKTNRGPANISSDSGSSGSTPGGSGDRRRNLFSRGDSDEVNVTLSFNFTGTAIYLYGIQPQGVTPGSTTTPANMNLTFTLDGFQVGNFSHLGSDSPDGQQGASPRYASNIAVFSKNALEDVPHQLVVHVGENSSFIFDYLVFSTNTTTNSSSTPTTPLAQTTPSASVDPSVKKHNVATFGGVVGGVVGALALFSLGLALSIIRRRRLAAARDKQDNESRPNGPDDSPHMSGPAPFVPRFFPDTVIPTEPPTYMVALATNANNSTLLSSLTSSPYAPTTRSYADIPPSTPPPLEDAPLMPPPPPFPGTRPSNLPVGALPPSIPGENQPSHISDPVGTNHSNSAAPLELVPLLLQHPEAQSVITSPSRASSRSYDINGNPVDDDSDDDL